jgi:hypothetical protein
MLQRAQYSTSWELTISHTLKKLSTFHGIKLWNSYVHKILKLDDILNEWREKPPSLATRRLCTLTDGWPCHLTWKPSAAGVNRPVEVTTIWWLSQLNESRSVLVSWEPFGCLDWGLSVIVLSCKANVRVHNTKLGDSSHSPPQARRLQLCACQWLHISSLRQRQPGLTTQTANQAKHTPV